MSNTSIVFNKGRENMLYRNYTPNANLSATERLSPTQQRIGYKNVDLQLTQTDITTPIPFVTKNTVDDGTNTLTGADAGVNSTSNTEVFKEGPNVAIREAQNLLKDDSSVDASWVITDTSSEGTNIEKNRNLGLWIFVKDTTILSYISTFEVRFGSDASNYFTLTKTLGVGWNFVTTNKELVEDLAETGTVGATVNRFEIHITTNNAEEEFSAGDVVFDWIFQWTKEDTFVPFTSGYPQLNFSTLTATERVRIDSLQANGFPFNVNATYNGAATEEIQSGVKIPALNKTSIDEFIIVRRNRIL